MTSAWLPRLTTPRLKLRPITKADEARFHHLLVTPAVRRYLCDDRILSRAEVAALVARGDQVARAGLGFWTVWERPARFVGCLSLLPVPASISCFHAPLAGLLEPAIAFAPDAQGRGLAYEALERLLDYAYGALGLPRIAAVADEPNRASRRLLTRLGFQETALVRGDYYPLVCHEMTRARWMALHHRT